MSADETWQRESRSQGPPINPIFLQILANRDNVTELVERPDLPTCPFCGGMAVSFKKPGQSGVVFHHVACAYEGCVTMAGQPDDVVEANWSRRVP